MTVLLLSAVLGLVPLAQDLQRSAAAALQRQTPLVLYFSRSDCTFCARLERDVLGPLMNAGEYADLVLVELMLDAHDRVRGLDGRLVQPAEVGQRFEVVVTPTLLFVDAHGREIAPRMVGYNGSDYQSFYVEQRIRDSARALGAGDGVR